MDNELRTGKRTMFVLTCVLTGETQVVVVCPTHAKGMPLVDRDRVRAEQADDDCECELCQ